jgi:signal transduction histidine kinase
LILAIALLLGVVAVLARRLQRATAANRALRTARDHDAAALAGAKLALARVEQQVGALQADATAAASSPAFLAGLSHDLRNLLAPLLNGLQLRPPDHDPAQRSLLVIERSASCCWRRQV